MIGRNRLALAVLASFTLSACASGGAGTATDTAPPADEGASDVPERTYETGTEPSNNVWTRSAEVYLLRAEETSYEPDRRAAYDQALEQALQSVENDPGNPQGYYQAGVAYLGLDNLEEAAEMFDRAVDIYPAYVEQVAPLRERAWVNYYNQAAAALQQNDEAAAVENFELADLAYAGRPEARLALAVIYTNRGEYERAIDYYEGALEILQSDRAVFLPAETQAEWAERESGAILSLAQVLTRADRADEAIALYEEHLQENPDDATVKVQLALALTGLDRDAEAAELFAEVLSRDDLTPEQYYQVGVGLFNAGQFENAATAFERTVEANPYARDALYNLSQALLARTGELSDDPASSDEHIAVTERLIAVAEQLIELDPLNRNALAMLAGAYNTMADATSGATSDQWRNRLAGILQRHEDMPYELVDLRLTPVGSDAVMLQGELANLNATPGSAAQLQFSLLNASGTPVATQDVEVDVPAEGESTPFSVQFDVQGDIAGWSYETVE